MDASSLISVGIPKCGKAHTIEVTCMLGEPSYHKQLDTKPLSNDSVNRKTESMALNIKENVIGQVKK